MSHTSTNEAQPTARVGQCGQQTEFEAKTNTDKDMIKTIEKKFTALEEQQKKEKNIIGALKDRFKNVRRSVFAKHPFLLTESAGIQYFEIKIKSCKNLCSIGLATKVMPLDGMIGQNSDSCAYESNGYFWVNGSYNSGKPTFYSGDFVGCGINLATRRIIFTKNGQPLDTSALFLSPPFDLPLFPFISLNNSGDLIETNFGPTFKFDPKKVQVKKGKEVIELKYFLI
ncbi:hypothetical protein niasHS_011695 [Heterodera schachtii]|uniref:B30.2/SPRY domain-containing protein n=1 Tax=Heterodera schachtii TaxID=97005 RepID=A0ABD2IQF9_HETSC